MSQASSSDFEQFLTNFVGSASESPLNRYFADPHGFFTWARTHAPILHVPEYEWWLVSRYQDISKVLRNPSTFSPSNVRQPVVPISRIVQEQIDASDLDLCPALVDEEGPEHRRHRRIFGRSFSSAHVERFSEIHHEILNQCLEEIYDQRKADLLQDILLPTASRAMFNLLGGKDEDFDLRDWPAGKMHIHSTRKQDLDATSLSLLKNFNELWSTAGQYLQQILNEPNDSYLGNMVRLRRDDPTLFSNHYLRNIIFLFQTSGIDNQSLSLAHGVWLMLSERDKWEEICESPDLIPNAIEEVLRYCNAIMAWPRLVTTDTEISGYQVPKGAKIMLLLAAGNRDETVFKNAQTFDIKRENARDHLSFGKGVHFCLGAFLARLQMKNTLYELVHRMPSLRLVDTTPPKFSRSLTFRAIHRFMVEWD